MQTRRYYQDAYTTQFQARITARPVINGRPALVLDQTYFYPESGGQPADQGQIDGRPVIDVQIRPEDGAVLHFLAQAEELWADTINASINWERRFDHMQQHTGQHILSQAFIQIAAAETAGFHLGTEAVTIDLDRTAVSGAQVEQAEQLANQIVWENRPIRIHELSFAAAALGLNGLTMRKIPPLAEETVRVIEIDDFDLTACGGTHVRHTGEVGLIKIIRLEKRRDQLRVEFRCGRRALADYRLKNSIINRLAGELTTGFSELEASIKKLKEELKSSQQQLRQREKELLNLEADKLLARSQPKEQIRVIRKLYTNRDPGQLRHLASQIAQQPGCVALLATAGEPTQFIFARAEDAPGEMDQLLKIALQVVGSGGGRGGGRPQFAQGGCPTASPERVEQALSRVERLLWGQVT
jgi:alanyl-tRNA synthetase